MQRGPIQIHETRLFGNEFFDPLAAHENRDKHQLERDNVSDAQLVGDRIQI
jgi:hypothetical protein